ncbi:hypothetical protein TVAG_349950 [Trichomonas vaginalis G3]|uniref:Uncharacterized protein n=1 Tax=Trichomonas vaginalis (strain ATCC PRA-98 / G3) TaxID=412133 RepID=A2FR18_TRIV3|nr:hypothetical protein TVAGG3_0415910 [Trichomonas vaginalis G3]EAX92648.1 hypothetical protein TVAG_349950 [Trichomonas vaginalis G3]KAI5535698.1 hypothetical protein TVAGG3_0415910 [Trichomonas vaginalis G3]|eukprot:XP_001305578.1 hypothetical protein [Trichomonas vaginalis G3]
MDRKEEASSQNCVSKSLSNDLKPENQVLITKYVKIESKSAISQNDFNESFTPKVVVKEGSIINSEKADEIKIESKITLDKSNNDQNSFIKADDESTHIILKNEAEISELKTSQENEAETHQDHRKSSDYISKKEHISSQSNENHDETKNTDGTSKENDQSKLSSYYRKLKMMKNKIKFPNSTSKSIEKPNDISSGKIKECPDSYILERIKKNEPKISISHSISQEKIKSQSLTEERKSFMNIASNYNKTHQNLTESQQKQRISLFEKESKVPVFFKKIQEIQNGNTDETVVIHGNQSIFDRLTKNISESKSEAMHQEDSHFMAKDFICSHVFVPFQPK